MFSCWTYRSRFTKPTSLVTPGFQLFPVQSLNLYITSRKRSQFATCWWFETFHRNDRFVHVTWMRPFETSFAFYFWREESRRRKVDQVFVECLENLILGMICLQVDRDFHFLPIMISWSVVNTFTTWRPGSTLGSCWDPGNWLREVHSWPAISAC